MTDTTDKTPKGTKPLEPSGKRVGTEAQIEHEKKCKALCITELTVHHKATKRAGFEYAWTPMAFTFTDWLFARREVSGGDLTYDQSELESLAYEWTPNYAGSAPEGADSSAKRDFEFDRQTIFEGNVKLATKVAILRFNNKLKVARTPLKHDPKDSKIVTAWKLVAPANQVEPEVLDADGNRTPNLNSQNVRITVADVNRCFSVAYPGKRGTKARKTVALDKAVASLAPKLAAYDGLSDENKILVTTMFAELPQEFRVRDTIVNMFDVSNAFWAALVKFMPTSKDGEVIEPVLKLDDKTREVLTEIQPLIISLLEGWTPKARVQVTATPPVDPAPPTFDGSDVPEPATPESKVA